jgi:hypothetical protein
MYNGDEFNGCFNAAIVAVFVLMALSFLGGVLLGLAIS